MRILPKVISKTVKAYAAATDLNIGISNNIVNLYAEGVAAASQMKVDIPVKNIPLFIPSATIGLLGLPPNTPQGYLADGLSAVDSGLKIFGSDGLDAIFEESKKKC